MHAPEMLGALKRLQDPLKPFDICDTFVAFIGKSFEVRTKRIEVRTGEVSKAQIIKNIKIMSQAASLAEKLGAGPGVIALQLFLTSNRKWNCVNSILLQMKKLKRVRLQMFIFQELRPS